MNKYLCRIGITIYFYQRILEFEVCEYHNNYSLQHFLGPFFGEELLNRLKRSDKFQGTVFTDLSL